VAHFLIRAIEDKAITIFGDGKQVRDVLFVEDLVDAFLTAQDNMGQITGEAFNLGGGPRNTTSLIELLQLIGSLKGNEIPISHDEWRPGDQHYYVSDIKKFNETTGWYPKHNVEEGIAKLYNWLCDSRGIERPMLKDLVRKETLV
ncbi:MAG TPA: GDP-mannose 4,6-dehydratase, partial [Cytophagaceae bacterium]|jgi:CDP-paratose 2-epimerase